jgi:transposase
LGDAPRGLVRRRQGRASSRRGRGAGRRVRPDALGRRARVRGDGGGGDDERRLEPIDASLLEVARADGRARLLRTIPGVGWLLALTFAVEIGDVSRFSSAAKLVGYSGLVPRVSQSGESSRTGRLSRAGSPLLRWAAGEAAQHAWRPQNPWHRLYVDVRARHGNGNAAKSAVARKVLIAVWHVWSRQEVFKPAAASAAAPIVPASSGQPLAA